MRKLVFDIETKNVFHDVGVNDPAALDISVVGTYDSETGFYRAFVEEEFGELWNLIRQTDALVGFNSDHFDIPLLNKYYAGDLAQIKSIDLLKEIKNSLGRRIKLDTIAEATLGKGKTGNGLEAVTWWRNGEYEKVKKYCLEDVKITKELYDYALTNKELKYKDFGKIISIPLDTTDWEEKEDNPTTQSLF